MICQASCCSICFAQVWIRLSRSACIWYLLITYLILIALSGFRHPSNYLCASSRYDHFVQKVFLIVDQFAGDGESRPVKTNATGRCLAYHTETIKRTILYGNMVNIFAGRRELFTINRQASQAIAVRPCLRSWYAAENHGTKNNIG